MQQTVAVVVLGDLGRSPRMKNHAISLANEGFNVKMIGYGGSSLGNEIISNPNISIVRMIEPYTYNFVAKRYINYIIKCIWQTFTLLWSIGLPDFILLQNPPSIPVLPLCFLYSTLLTPLLKLFGKKMELVLDWHNYAYSIMALSFKNNKEDHLLVRLSRFIESSIGSRVRKSFCVSNAMKKDLLVRFGADAKTLYDKPKESYGPITVAEAHNLFLRLGKTYPVFLENVLTPGKNNSTAFTNLNDEGIYSWNHQRPAILISSTSWTEDEDFGILLRALQDYDNAAAQEDNRQFPNLLCVITGKGPQKEYYRRQISNQEWRKVSIIAPWLEPEDYPKLLAAADLGVCLHTSSSGVDLPMKIVDMFGCELPVAAYTNESFLALPELVDKNTGMVFTSAEELCSCLKSWFNDFSSLAYNERKNNFKDNIKAKKDENWEVHWTKVAKPFFMPA